MELAGQMNLLLERYSNVEHDYTITKDVYLIRCTK
jgi:hypothetical protein